MKRRRRLKIVALVLAIGAASTLVWDWTDVWRVGRWEIKAPRSGFKSVGNEGVGAQFEGKSVFREAKLKVSNKDPDREIIEKIKAVRGGVMNVDGFPPLVAEEFGLDDATMVAVKKLIEDAKSELRREVSSRIVKVSADGSSSDEYFVEAFPERGGEIYSGLEREIGELVGPLLAAEGITELKDNLTYFFGWGRYDMKFEFSERLPDHGYESESVWNVEVSWLLAGSSKRLTRVKVPLDEANRVFGVFGGG